MAKINKKVWRKYFDKIISGEKKFELRIADFDIKEGDTLILEEWNPETKKYTGRKLEKKAGYILKFDLDKFGQKKQVEEKGLYVIQLE